MATLLPEKIYHQLRRKLIAGELIPGTRLDYRKISVEMGVSTTPVREAMGKLASEGLVDLIPRAGAVVRDLGRQEAEHLYGVREAIETYAAAKAAEQMSKGALQHLQALLTRMRQLIDQNAAAGNRVMGGERLAEFMETDLSFHMTIIESAANPRLTKLAGDSHIHSRIFGMERFGHEQELVEEADQIHNLIYRALVDRSPTKASELIASHIRRSLELTISRIDHAGQKSWWREQAPFPMPKQNGLGATPVISAP